MERKLEVRIVVRRSPGVGRGMLVSLMVAVSFATLAVLGGCEGRAERAEADAWREYQRGLALQEKGNLTKAGQAYINALHLNPRLAGAYAGRAYVFYAHENLPAALEDLAAATKLDPDLALAYNYRGLVYAALENSDAAILNYTKAVELDPQSIEARYNRAVVSLKDQDIDSAIEDMSAVIELEPQSPQYYLERARLHLLAVDAERAAVDLEQVLSLTEDETWVLPAKELLSTIRQSTVP